MFFHFGEKVERNHFLSTLLIPRPLYSGYGRIINWSEAPRIYLTELDISQACKVLPAISIFHSTNPSAWLPLGDLVYRKPVNSKDMSQCLIS